MIREFLFKVLIWMYNQIFIQRKLDKMSNIFYINNEVAKKFLKEEIRNFYKAFKIIALNKTTALLQDKQSALL